MARSKKPMNVAQALEAICSTGEGHCWYCDRRLPTANEAIGMGWDVQRVKGERVGSIILICPTCRRQKTELGEEGFLRILSRRVLPSAP